MAHCMDCTFQNVYFEAYRRLVESINICKLHQITGHNWTTMVDYMLNARLLTPH